MDAHILDLDRPRKLKFGFKALKVLKQKYGEAQTLTDVMNVEVSEIPFFAWAGLIWEDEDLTMDRVEDLIEEAIPDKYTILDITTVIVQAIADHVGVKKKGKKKKKQTPSLTTVKSLTKSGSPQKKSLKT